MEPSRILILLSIHRMETNAGILDPLQDMAWLEKAGLVEKAFPAISDTAPSLKLTPLGKRFIADLQKVGEGV